MINKPAGENQPEQNYAGGVSEGGDLESAIKRALTRALAGRIHLLSEPISDQPDDVPTESMKPPDDTLEAGENQTAATQENTPLEHRKTESAVSKKDPARRKKTA